MHRIPDGQAGRRGRLAFALVLGLVAAVGPLSRAEAMDLREALALAYSTNPNLGAELARLSATNELIAQALAGYRPTVEAAAQAGVNWTSIEGGPGDGDDWSWPYSVGVTLNQPLYTGGRNEATVTQAENVIQAGRARVIAVEQEVLLNSVVAYADVVSQQAVVQLAINNQEVLQRELQAARERFEVGDTTRTDVSQAEASLAGATADRLVAEGNLRTAESNFVRFIGVPPDRLETPDPASGLPGSLERTTLLAETNNPSVIVADFTQRAAQAGIDIERSAQLPQAGLTASLRSAWNQNASSDRIDDASVIAQIRIPLYQGGAVESRVREARRTATQNAIELEESKRASIATAVSAWEGLVTARASIQSRIAQVRAAEIALEGVRQEQLVGARTVLDVLNAEQDLLNARVLLVQARRDEVVASYQVLAATGQLTALDLALPVDHYDFDAGYLEARRRW